MLVRASLHKFVTSYQSYLTRNRNQLGIPKHYLVETIEKNLINLFHLNQKSPYQHSSDKIEVSWCCQGWICCIRDTVCSPGQSLISKCVECQELHSGPLLGTARNLKNTRLQKVSVPEGSRLVCACKITYTGVALLFWRLKGWFTLVELEGE